MLNRAVPSPWRTNALEKLLHKETCTKIFIEVFFKIAKHLKKPKGPSIREWIQYYILMKNI